jgi:uncharacterized protein (TIGR02001 family)
MKLKSKLLLALLATSSAAFAQTAPAAPEVTYNVGVVSQYRYRGLAQTKGQPALQGGVDYANANGYYAGAWASTIKWIKDSSTSNGTNYSGSTELDLYGGYKFEASGIAYDVGFLRYQYTGNNLNKTVASGDPQLNNANTNEVYAAGTLGAYTFKWSYSLSNLFGAQNSKNSDYLDLSANYDLGNGITLTPHLGRAIVQGGGNVVSGASLGSLSYTDASLTVAKDLGNGLSATAAAITTNAKSTAFNSGSNYATGKSAVVLGVKYGF